MLLQHLERPCLQVCYIIARIFPIRDAAPQIQNIINLLCRGIKAAAKPWKLRPPVARRRSQQGWQWELPGAQWQEGLRYHKGGTAASSGYWGTQLHCSVSWLCLDDFRYWSQYNKYLSLEGIFPVSGVETQIWRWPTASNNYIFKLKVFYHQYKLY